MNQGWMVKAKSWALKHKRWLLGGGAVLVIAGLMSMGKGELTVTAHTVGTGPVQKVVEASAAVESAVARKVSGQIAGEVLEVLKAAGDPVKAGEPLAVIDVRDIELSISGLQAQKASLTAAFRDAERPSAEALKQAQASMEIDRIAVEAARRAYQQTKLLADSGAVSIEALKGAEEALGIAENTFQSSSAAYEALKKGVTTEQRNRYQADMAVLQAQIDQILLNRDRFKILSPVDGVVTVKTVDPGDLVQPGMVLFEIDDPEQLRLTADLLVQDAVRLAVGTSVRAYDADAGLEVVGRISKIYPKAFDKVSDLGIEQKRIRVEMALDPGVPPLTIGMELDLEIIEKELTAVLNVPDSAVFRINNAPHVFRIIGDKAVLTAVTVGLEGEDAIEITGGLTEGDQVIDAPANELSDGAKVKVES